jgi:hypothetical protein
MVVMQKKWMRLTEAKRWHFHLQTIGAMRSRRDLRQPPPPPPPPDLDLEMW